MSILVTWTDPSEGWMLDIPVGEGVVVTNTGDFQRLSEKWYWDELNTFCHECRRGASMRFIPGTEAYLRQLLSAWDNSVASLNQ
jgi:hypothetical protein